MKKLYFALFFFGLANAEKLNIKAENMNFINGEEGARYIKAKGDVEILYSEYKLCSGELIIDEKADKLTAKYDVKLMETSENGAIITTDFIESNKAFDNASISSFTFEKEKTYGSASSGGKENEIITFKNLKVSTCENAKSGNADWSILAKTAEYDKENDQITLYNTLFYAKEVPIFWLPFFTISPSRTHGFLAPEAGLYKGQYYLSVPYFISEKTKTHYVIIKPEFYNGSANPEEESRVNNLYSSYSYKKLNDIIFIEGKFAPNAYSETEPIGNPNIERESRYSLKAEGNFEYQKGNFGFEYAKVSDRFFRKSYNSEIENYLKKDAYFNFFSENKKHIFTSETLSFIPIAFEKTETLPQIDILSDYLFQTNISKNVKVYDETNLISVSREKGAEHTRISNSLGIEIKESFGRFKTLLNPEIRGDIYSKNYTSLTDDRNETLARIIPSLFIENKIPTYFKLKENNDYLFKLEPQFNALLTKENTNNDRIANEDSSSAFLNADSILLKNYISGYDLIDEGLSFIYGTSAEVKHLKTGSFGEVFAGQRAKIFLENSASKPKYSSYAGKFALGLFKTFNISENFLFSDNFKLQYSVFSTSLNFTYLDLMFQNVFISQDIITQNRNVSEDRYSVALKSLENDISFKVTLVKNNKFMNSESEVIKKNVYLEYLLTYLSDCFEYSIGVKRERYAVADEKGKYQLFGKFRLLLI